MTAIVDFYPMVKYFFPQAVLLRGGHFMASRNVLVTVLIFLCPLLSLFLFFFGGVKKNLLETLFQPKHLKQKFLQTQLTVAQPEIADLVERY